MPSADQVPTNNSHSRRQQKPQDLVPESAEGGGGSNKYLPPLANLAQLLRGRAQGIFVAPFEQGEIGPDLFEAACRMGLEGLVSKRRERAYRLGRCDHWVKVKNRKHPAFSRKRCSAGTFLMMS
jgi:bifunctional non-homologous end joining protein LigD